MIVPRTVQTQTYTRWQKEWCMDVKHGGT